MIRKITLLFLACLGSVFAANAQKCGYDVVHQRKMASDPAYASIYNAGKAWWAANAARLSAPGSLALKELLPGGDSVYEIPVVVHVIDTAATTPGSRYNPTTTQIQNTIDYVNQAYAGTWPNYPANTSSRIPIKFTLAKRSPSCGNTDGIVRVNGATALGLNYVNWGVNMSASGGVSDQVLKATSYWPNTEYYNIWVVNRIDSVNGLVPGTQFTAGYAYPPIGISPVDGTVMLASQFNPGQITLVHELGHAFDLPHTFEGENLTATPLTSPAAACPPNNPLTCSSDGDGICDTEPNTTRGAGPGTCPSGINPCTGVAYIGGQYNFMNYTNCQNRFTAGQRAKVMYALFEKRGWYLSSLGATAPSAPLIAASCTQNTTNPNNTNTGPSQVLVTKTSSGEVMMNVTSEGYSGDGGLAYIDKTCKHRLTLTAGTQYSIKIKKMPFNQQQIRVYLDVNNDGDFLDPGESLFSGNTGFPVSDSIMFNYTVPLTGVANCTELRMRVMTDRVGTIINSCTAQLQYGQSEDYSVLIKGAGTTSNVRGAVTLSKPPAGGNPSCIGTSLKFTAYPANGYTPVYFKWFRKNGTVITDGPAGGNDSTWTSTAFADKDTVFVKMAFPGLCGVDTALSDSVVVERRLTIPPAVQISQTKGTNPGCADDTVRFTVSSVSNPGGNPDYTWHIGTATVSTGTVPFLEIPSATYPFFLGNNEQVFVVMTSSAGAPCAIPSTATSNSFTYTHTTKTPTLTVALTGGTNPGCAGQTLTFQATGTVRGNNPEYQWHVNGTAIANTNSTTFSGVFNSGDVITCVMKSSSTCAAPSTVQSSNSVTITHTQLTADIQIAVVGGSDIACSGHEVIFSANATNAGANPNYEWMINNVPVPNSNSPIFATSSLANFETVSCVLLATDPCVANPRDTSNEIQMTIRPSAVPAVSIAITAGKNPWCLDSSVTFTATPANAGVNPNFEWMVNGFPSFNGPVFTNDAYLNGDIVTCRLNTTDGQCYLPDTVSSSPVIMIRSTLPDPPVIHLVGNKLITNKAGTYRWWGPAGLYETGTDGIFHPSELGMYMAVTDNNGCWSLPSNYLTITLLDVNTVDLKPVRLYPNPTSGELVLDWGNEKVNIAVTVTNTLGQELMHETVKAESRKVIDLSAFANGVYYITMKDDNGNTGTARVSLNR